jgi:hypothetical protein
MTSIFSLVLIFGLRMVVSHQCSTHVVVLGTIEKTKTLSTCKMVVPIPGKKLMLFMSI